jgi:hypothetical protein
MQLTEIKNNFNSEINSSLQYRSNETNVEHLEFIRE